MKIFQVFESYPLFYQPYIPPVIDALRKERDIDVKLLAFKGGKVESNGAVILPRYKERRIFTKIFQRLKKEYRCLDYFEIRMLKEKADIIHLQHSFLFSKIINLLEIPKGSRPKIIITMRGKDTYVKPWLSNSWRGFYMDFGHRVDAFIVMSEHQKRYLTRWGVPIENINVIPISFGKRFSVQPKIANQHQMRIVSVFRMSWEKNIVDSLKFIRALKQKNVPVVYDVYGDGADLGQLYYLRDKYNLNNEVNIFGKISNEQLKEGLKTYDFILQLSHSESLGMSVIEAQSFGVPAIVSDNGGLPEIILDRKNGFVVDLDDFEGVLNDVKSVWGDDSVYTEMSQTAIDRSHQNYSLENEIERLTSLYLNLYQCKR